jgi:hypothetical protein
MSTLTELRALLAKATPGPWTDPWTQPTDGRRGPDAAPDGITGPDGKLVLGANWYDGPIFHGSPENCAALVALRNSAPALLDVVEAAAVALRYLDEVGDPLLDSGMPESGCDSVTSQLRSALSRLDGE